MKILFRSIHTIDLQAGEVIWRDPVNDFDSVLAQTLRKIDLNDSSQSHIAKKHSSSVVLNILRAVSNNIANILEIDMFKEFSTNIAEKLLNAEMESDKKVKHMNVSMQKGSLFQALVYKENLDIYEYYIAKVEHSDFVDDESFLKRIGFNNGNQNIWKSCQFTFEVIDGKLDIKSINVHVNNKATYWTKLFLEVSPITSNAETTKAVYSSVEKVLMISFKRDYPYDFYCLKNALLANLHTNKPIDYDEMIMDIFEQYVPQYIDTEKYKTVIKKIKLLPESKGFEKHFVCDYSKIKARKVNSFIPIRGIKLIINGENEIIDNMEDSIVSYDRNGERFIRIKTTDEDTYRAFLPKK